MLWQILSQLRLPIPVGVDFKMVFYPVGRAVLTGKSPYSVRDYFNPPWLALLFALLAILPEPAAWSLYLMLAIVGYWIGLRRLVGRRRALWLMGSPFVFYGLIHGNVDWLVLLGMTAPTAWGLFLLVLKPQMTLWAMGVLAWRSWRQGRLLVVLPVLLALLACLALGWVPPASDDYTFPWSTDVWPWGIPVGVLLLGLTLWRDDVGLALAAAPWLSPYVAIHSWIGTLIPLKGLGMVVGVGVAWVVVVIRAAAR